MHLSLYSKSSISLDPLLGLLSLWLQSAGRLFGPANTCTQPIIVLNDGLITRSGRKGVTGFTVGFVKAALISSPSLLYLPLSPPKESSCHFVFRGALSEIPNGTPGGPPARRVWFERPTDLQRERERGMRLWSQWRQEIAIVKSSKSTFGSSRSVLPRWVVVLQYLFLLGLFLGRIARSNIWISAAKTLAAGLLTLLVLFVVSLLTGA